MGEKNLLSKFGPIRVIMVFMLYMSTIIPTEQIIINIELYTHNKPHLCMFLSIMLRLTGVS